MEEEGSDGGGVGSLSFRRPTSVVPKQQQYLQSAAVRLFWLEDSKHTHTHSLHWPLITMYQGREGELGVQERSRGEGILHCLHSLATATTTCFEVTEEKRVISKEQTAAEHARQYVNSSSSSLLNRFQTVPLLSPQLHHHCDGTF